MPPYNVGPVLSAAGYSLKRKAKARQQRSFQFSIEGIDGMGQGVARDGAKTCFIAKTLPGETGSARVYKASKGVSFAAVESLDQSADNRVRPECEHFGECPACHFLHTDYDSEIQYKLAALQRLLRGLPLDPQQIDIERAPERLGYRNRIQLHYRHKYIGMVDGSSDRIVEVPHCKIIGQQLQPALEALYADKSWSDTHPGSGHCEIYYKDGELRSSWNQRYADGGFTQVNDAMNAALRVRLVNYAAKGPANTVLDLFAGEGNLSQPLMTAEGVQRVMVDQLGGQQQVDQVGFYKLDLFDISALASLARREAIKNFDLMIVDPPRKGFAALAPWVQKFKPKQLIYVSCNAATMARDLKTLQGKYSISDICLMDLFPATYHFETMVRIEFKNHNKNRSHNKK
jgi:23S rRNA (uracil1939-C5)-methyltransferase